MTRHLIKISWLGLLACYAAGYYYLIREWHLGRTPATFVWLGALGLLFWIHLTIRLFSFKRKLATFSRNLFDGNYETGIKMSAHFHDEVRSLAGLVNKAADRLRLYDTMRAEKVALNARAREIIYNNTSEAVIMADIEKRLFQLNPAARDLFEIDQESMTFDSIEKREENAQFTRFFKDTVDRDRVPREKRLTITLPIRGISKEIVAKIVPVKDREEKVKLALIFLK
jgi:PAS domain-containing protein